MRLSLAALGFACAVTLACTGPAEDVDHGEVIAEEEVGSAGRMIRVDRAIPNQYIVRLKDDLPKGFAAMSVGAQVASLQQQFGGEVFHTYQAALRGFAVRMSPSQAAALARHPMVEYVQQDSVVTLGATQSNATWGLDRSDQRDLPLNGTYVYNNTASNVNAYIIDTGILLAHQEFAGRVFTGFDAVTSGGNANDCNGHGTHVAGTVGGTTYGLAKAVKLYAIRVLSCTGSGTNAGVIAGVDWVTANHVKPAVANMSLGGGANQALDDAVRNSISAGVTYALAAGNDNQDACNSSPSRTLEAITVGSSTNTDARSSFSNWGTCVDIFAPGSSITSAWHTGTTATNTISGTSMASPHVAGAAALYLSANPAASPAQVASALINNSTPNKITSPGTGSPNRLLYTAFIGGGGGDTTPPTASLTAPSAGATVSGTVTVSASASDNVGVTRVDFYAGSTQIGSDTSAPYSISWDTTSAANGSVALKARAWDANGNMGDSATVGVTVNNPGQAAYDSALGAPKCGTVGNRCDSGALLDGRNNLGPEPNQPNTVDACTDGASGTYHSDESLDALKIYSGGANFGPGVAVTIEARVWAWTTPSSDTLEIYHAKDATNPVWTLVASVQPTAGGAQTLTASFTLPNDGTTLQAIRGRFRYQGTAGACGTGSYDDHDDLAFAAGGGTADTTAPTTAITSPANGATVSGTVTISAGASDNVGVTKVEFYRGTTLLATDTTAPYSTSWTTTSIANGTYSLTTRAYDAAGNVGTSAAVSVTVNNTTASQLLTNGGFETSSSPWVATGTGALYTANGAYPQAGTGYIYLGASNSISGAWYQQISIPSGSAPALSFYLNVTSSETTTSTVYDRLFVEVRNTSGTLLATLATFSNVNKTTAGSYTLRGNYSLASYAGQTVRIQFRATTDSLYQTTFRIDTASVK